MSKSNHEGTGDAPQNQNNAMSDDPGDGNRTSFTAKSGEKSPVERAPSQDRQGEDTIEAFGEAGAGSKEQADG